MTSKDTEETLREYPELKRAIDICASVRLDNTESCETCKGSGEAPAELSKYGIIECNHCEGSGRIEPFCPRVILNVDVDRKMIHDKELMGNTKCGDWVAVRPCDDQYNGKTFLGIYLGDLPIDITVLIDKKTHKLQVGPHCNPAMYVPDIKKIIYGCGSWWHKIVKPEDLKQLTDQDIENVWYVRAMKEILEGKGEEENPGKESPDGNPEALG